MSRPGNVALLAALACFAVYFANVLAGAFGSGVLFRDVTEMLLLLASCVFFVIGILAREAAARPGDS
jgi:ABC-type polysaccharide/polyol phosphate export permease